MRAGPLAALIVGAAVLGGAVALGIGKGAGWVGSGTKTVVVASPSQPAALPEKASSNVAPLPGKGFDPQRIFAERSPGVVTIFAYFGDPADEGTQVSQGSGFVTSASGYVLTNSHVITNAGESPSSRVEAADRVFVEFADGDRAEATIVGWDLFDDVGLMRINSRNHRLSPVPLGASASVSVGDPVAAIGSPLGTEIGTNSLAVGVVSAIHRSIDAVTVNLYRVIDAIQTDAPITHGSSGGPLFDARGRVIGINAQIRSTRGGGNDSGIGFAIPIDAAKHSMAQLIANGRVRYAYLGIETEDMTPSLARATGYKVNRGALIADVKGGPARDAGLRGGDQLVDVLGRRGLPVGGDVVVAIDGRPVRSADDLVRIVSFSLKPNDIAVLTIVRDGRRQKVAVTLAERQLPD
jgi:S1-C subfamily serine protease